MSYIQENLIGGEMILYRTGLHWIALVGPGVISVVFTILGIFMLIAGDSASFALILGVFGVIIIGSAIMIRRGTEMAVTNKRVVVKVGLLRRRTIEIFLLKVESIGVDQGLLGRVFGYGNIVVRGTGGTAEPFRKVKSPLEFRRQVQQQTEALSLPTGA